jgi:hypothetical protein
MTKPGTQVVLNRVLTTLYRSLPMYLAYATPWTQRGDDKAVAALQRIVADQKQMANRIAQYVLEHHGPIEMGEYPVDFLDTHDLALDFLVSKLVQCQKQDIAELEKCVALLQSDRPACALAEEALGAARGHLESLEELTGQLVKWSS